MAVGGAAGGCNTGAGWVVTIGATLVGGVPVVLGAVLLGGCVELSGAGPAGVGFGCAVVLAWEAGGCWANTTPNTAANAALPNATDRLTAAT